ncbi:glutathione S-transferase family protein [Sphingomonas hankyongi]|uniref:Glutathione S-transferase family protein n=1 Tax=Sphingomonas hankyongi TaxID=2908209 RepID=A0ABT0RYX6_9SPHN|nr:glutathione S-transferase family protein [Sphingomonas hankyongi]MCL6728814.1 glutathione S-transferase family protein [Sphingomonas hankyongi]
MDRPLTVIGSFVSPYVRKVLACLSLKGLAYEVDPITPFFGNDEFERLSPLRRIPVLTDGDFHISDSSVICAYIDEAYPGHPLYPRDPKDRARSRWVEEFADSRLGELFIWDLFYQKVVRPLVWGEAGDQERIDRALTEGIPAALDYLEEELPAEGWLFEEIGVGDISVASFFRNGAYAGFEVDGDRWPRTAAFVQRVLEHSAMASLLPFEDVQRSVDIKGRRQALLDAGAPLSPHTWGVREARKGPMRL